MAETPTLPPLPAPLAKPPGKIKRFFLWIIGIPRRALAMSVPAKAAWVAVVVLLAIVAVAWTALLADPDSVPWSHVMTPDGPFSASRIVAVAVLLVLIPLFLYLGLKLWLEGDMSRFPDVDFAWRAGLTALERNGLDISSVPIFLVLGSASPQQERALFDASGLALRVRGVPEGPAPLHWYASPEAIYVCCTEASWTSALAAFEATRSLTEMSSNLASLESPVAPAAPVASGFGAEAEPAAPVAAAAPPPAPMAPMAPPPAARPMGADSGNIRGTIMLDQYAASLAAQGGGPSASPVPAPREAAFAAPAAADDPSALRGTMMLEGTMQAPPQPSASRPQQAVPQAPAAPGAVRGYAPAPAFSAAPRQPALLATQESAEQLERLQHVCRLLRRARQPLCGVNGVLALLPIQVILGTPREVEELQRGVKADLRTLSRALELHCPVTALVVGMEQEPGFRELVRRVGRDRASVQRFGQRYDLRSVATADEMNALCAHVCGAFEDWVYTLFREQGALSKPGNTQLYGLLCKVQLTVKHRLAEILAGGFGYDPHQRHDEAILFSGCYFAAIGESEDRQAFAKGVFNKLVEEQEQIEWTPHALASHRRYLWAAYTGLTLDAALAVALAGMIAARIFWR